MRQPYRVESITLNEIGVFDNTHFDFPAIENEETDSRKAEIHIFTGPNGCGKSTLLYALAGVFSTDPSAVELVSKRYHGIDSKVSFHFCGEKGDYGVKKVGNDYNIISNGNSYYYAIGQGAQAIVSDNRPWLDMGSNFSAKKFDYVAIAYSGSRASRTGYNFSSIQNISQSPFSQSLSFDQTVRPELLAQWIANNRTQSALARHDDEIEEADQYDSAINNITAFVKDICQLDLSFHLKRSPLEVQVKIGDKRVSLDTLPEGLKSIISWIADLALRLEAIPWKEDRDIFSQPIFLLLDEVDIHLHPKWQRRILPAIQKLLPNAQVFVSTHSPFVVGSVEDAYVYSLPEPSRNIKTSSSAPKIVSGVKSAAGKSYQMILAEVFGIEEEFDVETERQLTEFKESIRQHLKNRKDDSEVLQLAEILRDKSEELAILVSMELRQMSRLLSKK